jgi:hypothetical protein
MDGRLREAQPGHDILQIAQELGETQTASQEKKSMGVLGRERIVLAGLWIIQSLEHSYLCHWRRSKMTPHELRGKSTYIKLYTQIGLV